MDTIKKISVQLHFHAFSLIIARKIKIISEEYIKIPKENFTPFSEFVTENGIVEFNFFEKLRNNFEVEDTQPVFMKNEMILKFIQKFIIKAKSLKLNLEQQSLGK